MNEDIISIVLAIGFLTISVWLWRIVTAIEELKQSLKGEEKQDD